jgi:methyltransferase
MADLTAARRIEQIIRTYIEACNNADARAIAACFCSDADAVHYIPWLAKWSGADTIGGNFAERVRERGLRWTVDQLLVDVERCSAILEWTQFDWTGRVVRGVDWFVFEPHTLEIREIRSFIAAAPRPDAARQELQDFDYAGRGYPTIAPSG